LLAVPALVPLAPLQDAQKLVLEGDIIGSVGVAVSVENLEVNDAGDWLVEVDTNNPDETIDFVVLRSGAIFQVEGDALAMPAGANIDTFDSMILNGAGELVQNFVLGNTGSTSDNAGVYFDGQLVLQKGQLATAAGFGPGTIYGAFEDVQLSAATNRQIYLRGWVDDPTVPTTGTSDWVALLIDIDAAGSVTGQALLAKEGQVLPGQTAFINTVRSGPHAGAFNDVGEAIFGCDLDGDIDDAVVYHWSGGTYTLLAQEGQPSGVGNLVWGDLVSPEVDLNDAGDWTIKDRLDAPGASDGIIVKNGMKFVQEGDSLPEIAPYVFDDFGNGAAALTKAGDVLWYGEWTDPDTNVDSGLFLNDQLIVQEGVTMGGGVILDTIGKQSENYRISPSGQYVIFWAVQLGGFEGAFLLDLGAPLPDPVSYCTAKPGLACGVPAIGWSGVSSAAATSGFQITAAPGRSERTGVLLYTSGGRANLPFPSGGHILCISASPLRRGGPTESGGTPGPNCDGVFVLDMNAFAHGLWVPPGGQAPNNPAPFLTTVGQQINVQWWGRDTPATGSFMSDGLEYVIGL
jgi:hypothetical protein